ncbi:MAG: ABC transporter ATP-binding protein [Synechococcaceae bacterium WBA_2_066]|nr:ABC transporter ATP-binding protein [Synechococcaceae bacterium WB6_1A_059]NBP33444.1 ABC transporter ATP-binding protein [Synechococcaceae bacterium WB6_1B_055]NBQ19013.1 ABC transporter ATP-binding protein [Synechococcaceae bacterium WB5_2A_257]NBR43505.1 ABC transporter ATP-binding protein [Synechococcaceae bacterium WB5_2B_268]NBY59252.1 ABC transporter ATP-binding protein [Synechococcaceae bacterium LLD_019]NCU76704.1 ABC transporter ATP-binding protein [Synechococcaceae bacterium WB7_
MAINPSSGAIAELINISKIYGEGATQVRAVNELNLKVFKGDYLAVMGTSGSGKSTAMNILGCLDRPSSGSYWLLGQEVNKLSDDDLATLRNRHLGFVFQQFHLLSNMSALENVELPMIYANVPVAERKERAAAALQRVGLGERLKNKPNQLSGGQQQRVAIARAIINRPALLLADEPTGALDSDTTREILAIFDQLNQEGMTVLLVTHEQDVAQRAQRVLLFRDGHIAN